VKPFLDSGQDALLEERSPFRLGTVCSRPGRAARCTPTCSATNALFEKGRISGVIRLLFRRVDCLLYDIAVCAPTIGAWFDGGRPTGGSKRSGTARAARGLSRDAIPVYCAGAVAGWPVMLRAAALRFWLSRLHDFHLLAGDAWCTAHDPGHFRRLLESRTTASAPWID